ncbi:hypothetical protein ACQP1W_01135 [Spirillospora sp. CA-255316]
MADSNGNQKRVTITLRSVYCGATEDAIGPDEFYIAGGAGTGPRSGSKSKAVLTRPIEINTRQQKILSGDEYVIFDDNVYIDDFVEIGLEIRDQDFSDDFDAKYRTLLYALNGAVGTAVGSLAGPTEGAVAGAILAATPPALTMVLSTIANDDVLGTVQKRVNIADCPDGRSGPFKWKFSNEEPNITEGAGTPAGVDWDYEVSYVIDVGPAR